MIRRASLAIVVLGCLGVVIALPAAAHHSYYGYHWNRTKYPVVKIGDNVDSSWKSYLATAAGDWKKSSVIDTTIVAGNGCQRPTIGRVEICTNNYAAGWMGATSVDAGVGNHIIDAVIKLNNKYLPNTKPSKRQLAICHELGHSLGLAHQDERFDNPNLGSCMDYTSKPSGNEHPNQGDYDQLLCIYDPAVKGKTLRTNTHSCTGTGHVEPAAVQGADADGQPIGAPQQLEDDLYVQDLDNGNKRYTWVLWADPRAAHAGPPTGG
jgi:hypothetical protein